MILFTCDQPPVKSGHGTGALNYHLLKACERVSDTHYLTCEPAEMRVQGLNPGCDFVAAAKLLAHQPPLVEQPDCVFFGTGTFQLSYLIARREDASYVGGGDRRLKTVIQCMMSPDVAALAEEHKTWGIPWSEDGTEFERIIEDRVLKECDMFISPSQRGAAEFIRLKGVKSEQIVIAPYGIDYPEIPLPLPEGEAIRALHIAQVGPAKGHRILLEAWIRARSEWQLRMAGRGTEHIHFPVPPRVQLLGRVNDLTEHIRWSNVYVHPSISETWGLPVVEMMSHARPVIVTRGSGAADCVRDGKDGLVIECSPDAILEAVQYFHDNPAEIQRMGANAREQAKHFTWDRFEEIVAERLREMLK